jgi:16S rRNA (guanine527-N7)-methyltransferase
MSTTLAGKAEELGFGLSSGQIEIFGHYAELLLSSGRRAGVTAIAARERIEQRHFVESLALAAALVERGILSRTAPSQVLDVGTGGGMPGLPIKIVLPHLRVTLIDARERSVAFLREVIASSGLRDVNIVTARAEDAGRDPAYREQFDVVLARALAPLPVLLELTLPFLRAGGYLAAPKGSRALSEIEASRRALDVLGGAIVSSEALNIPDGAQRQRLVIVRKVASTPSRYPRRAGIPKKRPV